jgi:hypothetical protein
VSDKKRKNTRKIILGLTAAAAGAVVLTWAVLVRPVMKMAEKNATR